MPQLIPAVVAALKAVAAWKIGAFAIGKLILNAIAMATLSALMRPKSPVASDLGYRTRMSRDPDSPRRVVYGRVRVSGPMLLAHTSGTDNKYLWLVLALAGHKVDAIEDVYFGDTVVPLDGSGAATGTFSGHAQVNKRLGLPGTAADATLSAAAPSLWTADHRCDGIATLVVKLTWNADLWPTGIPNVSAIVKGAEVFDPRTEVSGWSDNPALCLRDYLTNTVYGLGVPEEDLDEDSFMAAADACEEAVPLAAGGTEARYTCNGSFLTNSNPTEVIDSLLGAMAGTLQFVGGRFVLQAGVWEPASGTLTEADLRGPIAITPRPSRRATYNAVKGTFVDPTQAWQPVDFPSVVDSAAVNSDGEELWSDIVLPFTTSRTMAQRIARIALRRGRHSLAATLPCKLTALRFRVGDTIAVTLDRYGWSSKPFLILGLTISTEEGGDGPGLVVDLDVQETSADVFAWADTDEGEVPAPPGTLPNLPSPWVVGAPSAVSLTSGDSGIVEKADGTLITQLLVAWTAAVDANVLRYEVETKPAAASEWTPAGTVSAAHVALAVPTVIDGVSYLARVRGVSALGVRSAWATSSAHTVASTNLAPATPTSVVAELVPGVGVAVSWQHAAPTKVRAYVVRANAEGEAEADLVETTDRRVTFPLPGSGTWFFRVRAIGRTGVASIHGLAPSLDLPASPSTPAAPAATAESVSSIRLTWEPPEALIRTVEVQRRNTAPSLGSWATVASLLSNSWSDRVAVLGEAYEYRVRFVDIYERASDWSTAAAITFASLAPVVGWTTPSGSSAETDSSGDITIEATVTDAEGDLVGVRVDSVRSDGSSYVVHADLGFAPTGSRAVSLALNFAGAASTIRTYTLRLEARDRAGHVVVSTRTIVRPATGTPDNLAPPTISPSGAAFSGSMDAEISTVSPATGLQHALLPLGAAAPTSGITSTAALSVDVTISTNSRLWARATGTGDPSEWVFADFYRELGGGGPVQL